MPEPTRDKRMTENRSCIAKDWLPFEKIVTKSKYMKKWRDQETHLRASGGH
jgi:hypothetical protein